MTGDHPIDLNLPQVFASVDDRAVYERSLDDGAALDPPLPEEFVRLVPPLVRKKG